MSVSYSMCGDLNDLGKDRVHGCLVLSSANGLHPTMNMEQIYHVVGMKPIAIIGGAMDSCLMCDAYVPRIIASKHPELVMKYLFIQCPPWNSAGKFYLAVSRVCDLCLRINHEAIGVYMTFCVKEAICEMRKTSAETN